MIISSQNDNRKKIPYARPVPRSFAAAWESKKEGAPRRMSRSPSPRRFDEPPPGWHRNDRPPREHRRPGRPRRPDDFPPMDERHPPMDFDQNRLPPPVEERIPPVDFPPPRHPSPPSNKHREPPREFNNKPLPGDQPFHEQRSMHGKPADRLQLTDQNHMNPDFNPQNFDKVGGGDPVAMVHNMNDKPQFPPEERRPTHGGMPPRDFGPNASRDRQFPPDHRPPPEMDKWNKPMNPGSEPLFSEDGVPLNPEALYGADYAELLAMDQEFEEAILANFDLQQEALRLSAMDPQFQENGPPRRGMRNPRGPFRGGRGQSHERGRGRGGPPRYPRDQRGRGRNRRGMPPGGFD